MSAPRTATLRRLYDRKKMEELMPFFCNPQDTDPYFWNCIHTAVVTQDFFIEDAKKSNITLSLVEEDKEAILDTQHILKQLAAESFSEIREEDAVCLKISDLIGKTEGIKAEEKESKEEKVEHPIFKALFTPSNKPEHLLIKIQFLPDFHGLVIEKESDGVNTYFTVHQSHSFLFTNFHWSGKDHPPVKDKIYKCPPWLTGAEPISPKDDAIVVKTLYKNLYEKFGRNKALNADEALDFLKQMASYVASIKHDYYNIKNWYLMTISAYRIEPTFLNRFKKPKPESSKPGLFSSKKSASPGVETPLLSEKKENCCVIL